MCCVLWSAEHCYLNTYELTAVKDEDEQFLNNYQILRVFFGSTIEN